MSARKNSGFIQFLLACGCVCLVAVIALVAAGVYYFMGRKAPVQVTGQTDSGQVKALSEQILPGFEPPAGHVGFLCLTTGNEQLAYIGPAGLARDGSLQPTQLLFAMDSFPAGQVTQDQAEKTLHETLVQQGWSVGKIGKVLEQQDATLKVRSAQARAQKRMLDGSPRLLEFSFLLENPQGRTVVLLVDGPLDSFNTPALETFLTHLQARPLGGPAMMPTPATGSTPESPAAEETPEPESTPSAQTPTPQGGGHPSERAPKRPH